MAFFTIRPTEFDEDVADFVASHTQPWIEKSAEAITWGADEHVLMAAAAIGWLLTRGGHDDNRRFGNHLLVCSVATACAPHLMKRIVNQCRPDRLTVAGHLRGVPLSGRRDDAFPSGHSVHIGALASAATLLPARWRDAVWAAGGVLVATRIVLLAHWTTDVLAGLGAGIAMERGIRLITKPRPITSD